MRTGPVVGPLEQPGVVLVEHEVHERRRHHQIDELLLAARVGDDAAERRAMSGSMGRMERTGLDLVGDVGVPHREVAREAALDELLEDDVGAVQRDLRPRVLVVVDLHGDRGMAERGGIRRGAGQRREATAIGGIRRPAGERWGRRRRPTMNGRRTPRQPSAAVPAAIAASGTPSTPGPVGPHCHGLMVAFRRRPAAALTRSGSAPRPGAADAAPGSSNAPPGAGGAFTVVGLGGADGLGLRPLGTGADLEDDLLALFEHLVPAMSMAE